MKSMKEKEKMRMECWQRIGYLERRIEYLERKQKIDATMLILVIVFTVLIFSLA